MVLYWSQQLFRTLLDINVSMNVRTKEHGRFYVGPHGNPRFAGSSSGVYLMDTIRNHLTPTTSLGDGGILEAFISRIDSADGPSPGNPALELHLLKHGDVADEPLCRRRFNLYFANWHPLFPYVDGALIHENFELALASKGPASSNVFSGIATEKALVLSVIIKSILSIGGLDQTFADDNDRECSLRLDQTYNELSGHLLDASERSLISDVSAAQAIFAIELNLFAARRFRPASRLSGLVIRLVTETGLHRCPCRYPTTFRTSAERELRKRLFFSIYTVDRFLSMEIGSPITLRDLDIDVCLPGAIEIHHDGMSSNSTGKRKRVASESPAVLPSNPGESAAEGTVYAETPTEIDSVGLRRRLRPAYTLAKLAGLMGRTMEIFNRSRRWRIADPEDALLVRTELDEWWNETGIDDETESGTSLQYTALYTALYHQQIIHINRHTLSLPPETVVHRHALQTTLLSSQKLSRTVYNHISGGTSGIHWPGYVDMLFTASLVSAYGAVLSRSTLERAIGVLQRVQTTLTVLTRVWTDVQPIYVMVKRLLQQIQPSTSATPAESLFPVSDWYSQANPFALEANPLDLGLSLLEEDVGPNVSDSGMFNLYQHGMWTNVPV